MFRITKALVGSLRPSSDEGFCFLETGALVDEELELVRPGAQWVDQVLAASQHPLTKAADPEHAGLDRRKLMSFLEAAPGGWEAGDFKKGRAPSYHFWMHLRPEFAPPVPIAGAIGLRVGHMAELELYYGHIGYNVYPPARGRHYAERACRLLLPLAKAHGLNPVWITTNPDNYASRRTCERLGAELVEVVDIPPNHPLYLKGQRKKCRYRVGV